MISFLLAGLAAVLYGVAAILQAVGARRAVAATGGTAGVVRQWPYMTGLGLDLCGWLLSLAASRHLPLFAVQAVLASRSASASDEPPKPRRSAAVTGTRSTSRHASGTA